MNSNDFFFTIQVRSYARLITSSPRDDQHDYYSRSRRRNQRKSRRRRSSSEESEEVEYRPNFNQSLYGNHLRDANRSRNSGQVRANLRDTSRQPRVRTPGQEGGTYRLNPPLEPLPL